MYQTTIIFVFCFVIQGAFFPAKTAQAEGNPKAGQAKYQQLCSFCHGILGKGDGPAAKGLPVKPADHTNQERMEKLADSDLELIIKEGGRGAGKSPLMPPFGNQLSPADVQNLIAFIRSLAK